MRQNRRSMLFISALVTIIVFLIGFRLGKRVERVDKSYVPPLTITPLPTPSPLPRSFSKQIISFFHPGCSVEFLYPREFSVVKNSSQEARLSMGNEQIYFTCSKVSLKDQKQYEATLNPKIGKRVYWKISPDWKTFIFRTLTFSKPTPTP